MSRYEALQMANAAELDLVEVSPTAEPPVVRIMDYGKFLFEQNKKAHSAKRKQKQIQVKEVKFRPGTGEADYQIKLRNLIRFLSEGDKAKVTLRFRGREMVHQDIGRKLLDRVVVDLAAAQRGRAEPADGRQADGHDVCTEKEVRAGLWARASPASEARACFCDRKLLRREIDAQVENQPGRSQAFSQNSERLQALLGPRRHNLGHKDPKRKRQLRSGGSSLVNETDVGRLRQLLPYST